MTFLQQIKLWVLFGSVVAVSVNMFIVQYFPVPLSYHGSTFNQPRPNQTIIHRPNISYEDRPDLTEKQFSEIYCLKEHDYKKIHLRYRPGLSMIRKIYEHLPLIKAQYSRFMPLVYTIAEDLGNSITRKYITLSPWKLATEWISPHSLIGLNASGLGDVLAAMKSYKIISADVGYKGTQLKMNLVLEDNQKVIFKPKRYGRFEIIEGNIYDGADRHNGEIAAFHLSRLLNLSMVPLAVGRKISLRRDILPISTHKLSSTFFIRGQSTCFYGKCFYCHKESAICDDGKLLEGSVILWLSEKYHFTHFKYPWARTYKKDQLARWEYDPTYCQSFAPSFFTDKNIPLLLKLVDVSIFDFLIQNGDRHHFATFTHNSNSSIILIDNGKSFGNPFVDHLDILAPLLQCCRIKKQTYEHLLLFTGGGLSKAMKHMLSTDPLDPVLSDLHLKAMDRRLMFILAAVAMCKDQTHAGKVFLSG